MATFTSLSGLAMLKAGEKFTQYKEYQKTGGKVSSVDDKSFYVGNSFVPRIKDLTVPVGDTWVETGYYVYPYIDTWVPTEAQVQNNISLSKLNQSGSAVYDDIYTYTYEIYFDIQSGALTPVIGARYLCSLGSLTYNGSTYYPGDTFVAIDNNQISPDGLFCKMYASTDAYAVLSFNTKSSLYQLVVEKAGSSCLKCWTELNNIKTQLDAISFMSETGNVALGPASKTLEWVNDAIRNFPTCNC
jgi:hypothetical protein